MLLPPVRRAHPLTKATKYSIAALMAGVFIGGAATAYLLWVLSGLLSVMPPPARFSILTLFLGVALAREVGLLSLPIPSSSYVIHQRRFQRFLVLGSFAFGLELGLGFRTRIYNAGPYVLAIILLLAPPGPEIVLVLAWGWALGRTFAVALRLRPDLREREHLQEASNVPAAYDDMLGRVSSVSARLVSVAGIAFALSGLVAALP